jgi:hypothetical protein
MPPPFPNGDKVQEAYVFTNEWSKFQRLISVLIEWIAAVLAISTLVPSTGPLEIWKPMIALFLTLSAVAIRQFADQNHSLAQKCRRSVMDCAVTEIDTEKIIQLSLCEQVSPLSRVLRPLIKKSNLTVWGYYGPYEELKPKGAARQAQLNAYSAFFTWRITKLMATISNCFFWILLLATILFVYISFVAAAQGIGSTPVGSPAASIDLASLTKVLDLICTGVIGFVCLRCFLAWKSAASTAKTCQMITESLSETPSTNTSKINMLSKEYEFERLIGKQPSTLLYFWRLNAIELKWKDYRELFKNVN